MNRTRRPRESPTPRPPLAAYAGAWAVLATVYAALYTASGVPAFMAARGGLAAVLPERAARARFPATGPALAVAGGRPLAPCRPPRAGALGARAGVDGGLGPADRARRMARHGGGAVARRDHPALADGHQRAHPSGAGGNRVRLAHGRGAARGARARGPGRRAAGPRRAAAAALAAPPALRAQRAPRAARARAARSGAGRERARASGGAPALRAVGAPDGERLGAAVARVGVRDELSGARARAPGRPAAVDDRRGTVGARGRGAARLPSSRSSRTRSSTPWRRAPPEGASPCRRGGPGAGFASRSRTTGRARRRSRLRRARGWACGFSRNDWPRSTQAGRA